jgi:hypothetical protein
MVEPAAGPCTSRAPVPESEGVVDVEVQEALDRRRAERRARVALLLARPGIRRVFTLDVAPEKSFGGDAS